MCPSMNGPSKANSVEIEKNEDSGEDDRIQVTFQLWHRSFELLNILFMFRLSAALFSIFRYLQPAGAILPNQMSV